jgi:hypothetical protein
LRQPAKSLFCVLHQVHVKEKAKRRRVNTNVEVQSSGYWEDLPDAVRK